ncbi:MAG TPA: MarR family transcriptional regulator [Candidatus Lachnoclostridium stercoravium]|uniref:MarR family transcriptional regulator n=1 Tax=Candidatus Lachnoclostridium stercoravium TaxID=2838633 RepID=A0A9D2KM26_9FIRM|nr:MarR family transcriptional regulator [Candidatus Lachnoclostridium stercoravium]
MEKLWRVLPRLYYSTRKFLLIQSHKFGWMKGRFSILDYVYLNDGCIQREIRDEFSLDASSVSNFLTALEKEGMLQRKRNSQCTREVNVYITEKGKETQKRMNALYDEMEKIVFANFSSEAKEQCLDYLAQMDKNMMDYLTSDDKN